MPCRATPSTCAVQSQPLPSPKEKAQHMHTRARTRADRRMQPAHTRMGWRYGSAFTRLGCLADLVAQWLSESGVLALWAAEDWLSYSDDLCLLMQLREM